MSDDGKDEKGKHLLGVIFNPSRSVTYRPIGAKQVAEIQLTNNEKTPVIFKWKSTRPGMYKMRPVYGVINVGEKITVSLFCKGIKEPPVPTSDRYTCVLAASPSANVNPANVFGNHKYQQKLAQSGKMRKVKIHIIYQGVNDQEPIKDEDDEDGDEKNEKDKTGNMRKKAKSEKPAPAAKAESKPSLEENKKKKPVIMMFTRKEGESESGEEDDESMLKTVGPAAFPNQQATPIVKTKSKTAAQTPESCMKTVAPAGVFNNVAAKTSKTNANVPPKK